MRKKVAVLVRDRQQEALRMAVGLTLADNRLTVFIMDRKLERNTDVDLALETLQMMGARIISNNPENGFEQLSVREIALLLPDFDAVIPY
ncbi:MAG: hypothetical protein K8I29_09925 [Alphaproteobacteria bacterium]|uniref:Uncharacterized protein n=1 Tax=Candidatus Nitrobium versatile TaxID=2884831 RepID=A0A953M1E2_9BACT|nr:hypothetical protein [Candidatus Nitrobium versatile]